MAGVTYVLSFRFVSADYHTAPILSSLGIGLVLTSLVTRVVGSDQRRVPTVLDDVRIEVGSLRIAGDQLIILVAGALLTVLLYLFLNRTAWGVAIRGVSDDADVSGLLGVPVQRVILLTFLLSGTLAGASGLLTGLAFHTVSPFTGFETTLTALTVIVIGGLGNITGGVIAALMIGVVETLTVAYLSATYGTSSSSCWWWWSCWRARRACSRAGPRSRNGCEVDPYTEAVIIEVGIATLLALGYWITAATGKFSFGHAAFMAIGAYTASILTLKFDLSLELAIVASGLTAAVAGALVGWIALRLTILYLAIITFAFAEIVQILLDSWDYAGGATGLFGMQGTEISLVAVCLAITIGYLALLTRSGRACPTRRSERTTRRRAPVGWE